MKTIFFLSAICFSVLTGCSVGPDYHPPKANAPAQWNSPLAGGTTNTPVADAEWWKNFHDPEIDAIILRALHSNLDEWFLLPNAHQPERIS